MTSDITIESLPLLARGGQADIYDLGDGKVLRFPRRAMDCERVRYEYGVYSSIADSGISAPKLYELVEVNETPAIVMERISGTSMIDQIRSDGVPGNFEGSVRGHIESPVERQLGSRQFPTQG